MQAILSGKLSILLCLGFMILVLGGLLLQRMVRQLRDELDITAYKLQRGPVEQAPQPPPPEERLPGYVYMTQADYQEVEDALRRELAEQKLS